MPQPDLIRHLNARLRARPGSEGDDHFELAGVREVQAHFRGRIFRSVFQPQIRRGGEVICHEAFLQVLARDGVGASPQTIFEQAGDDDAIALDRMARKLHVLNFVRQRGWQAGLLALNLSPEALLALVDDRDGLFEAVLADSGLPPRQVVLEVADHGFEDCASLAAAIARCRGRGYRVAIDNFGRFSCDIERLEALAPDIVKLDRCLIGHAGHLGFARRVLAELCAEVRRLGIQLVSQSIESRQQLQAAMASGVDIFQGYLIGRPAPLCLPLGQPAARGYELSA
jgi:EAL domain-containing protein (putative c-di-GMP-specific phosphodiesterase class I)